MSEETPLGTNGRPLRMTAARVHQFGGPEAIRLEQVPLPMPGAGQVLVQVRAAGVGPWDAWIRSGQSVLPQPLPLTLGSDLSGVVAEVGAGVSHFQPEAELFGVTNARFTDAYAEYAVAEAAMLAAKPPRLSHVEAASVPVVASTAWQMVFDHGQIESARRVLVHGAAGNVGAYAVQFAKQAGAEVIATTSHRNVEWVRELGADQVIDVQTTRFEEQVVDADVVLDTVGGETLERSFAVLKPGGILVSAVTQPDLEKAARFGVRAVFFLVAVTTDGLNQLAKQFDTGRIRTNVGEVLPLSEARQAHEMLAGKAHQRGKIVLAVDPE